jgi:hypothetical protein
MPGEQVYLDKVSGTRPTVAGLIPGTSCLMLKPRSWVAPSKTRTSAGQRVEYARRDGQIAPSTTLDDIRVQLQDPAQRQPFR